MLKLPNIYHTTLKLYGKKVKLSKFKKWFETKGKGYLKGYEEIQLETQKRKKITYIIRTRWNPPLIFLEKIPKRFPHFLFILSYCSYDDYIEGGIAKKSKKVYNDFSLPVRSELLPFDQKKANLITNLVNIARKQILKIAKTSN